MKKTRVLAALLCIMMIVCSLPVLQVSAAKGDTDASIASILGVDSAINVYDVQVDADFDGTDVATESSATTYAADGVEFSGESGASAAWILAPTSDFWTNTNAVVVKAKVGAGNRLTLYTEAGERLNNSNKNVSRTNILIADNRVYAKNDEGSQAAGTIDDEIFMVGDEWFELMVVHGETTFELYVKNNTSKEGCSTTGGVWKKLNYEGTMPYEQGHAGTTANHHFYAANKMGDAGDKTYLKSVSVFQEDVSIYTIEEALSTYPASFSEAVVTDPITMTASRNAWNFANSTMTSYKRDGGISTPSGASFTGEGLDLSGTNGTDAWKFFTFSSWAPASLENAYGGFRAFYVKVKGGVTISYLMSDNQYMNKLRSVPGKKLSESNASVDASVKAGNKGYSLSREAFSYDPMVNSGEWVEYLIVPRNTNASVVYAKSETGTGGGWVKAIGIEAYSYTPQSADKANTYNTNYGTSVTYDADAYAENRKNGIAFSGSGVVAEWKTIDFNNDTYTLVANDDESKPAAATHLWYGEEFNEEPKASKVLYGSAVSIENGMAYAPVKYANAAEGIEATNGGINFYDETIPVGGYAEFKMKSNGLKAIEFDDGTSKWNTTLNCDYSGFPGTAAKNGGYMADSDMSWRTWRVVRTANGYSVYSKADGDTGWRIHATDGVSGEGSDRARIAINFYGNADGVSDGNGMLDYLRIYGATERPEDDDEGASGSGGEGGEGQEPGGDEEEDTTIDTIAEAIQDSVAKSGATAGDTVAKVKTDDLYASSHDWNFANSTMETYYRSGNGSLAMPEGAEITSEGLDLSGTNGTDVWKYKPHDQWCFVNALRNGTTSFRAGYVKVKGNVTISFTGSEQKRLISVYSKPGTATTSGTDAKATAFIPDSDWVEYLFVPYNSNNVFIWAKKASDTVWTSYGRSGATEALTDATPNCGLHISGTGVVAGWKTIDFNENGYSAGYPDTKMVATNTEVTPATANTLVYGAEFDAVPTGATLGAGSEIKDGLLSTATTAEAQGDMKITNLAIPVNGYAEFKMKGNGAIEVVFDDGTNMFKLHRLPADNYAIQGTSVSAFAAFVNDSDMAWRTYRLVRTAEGYSFYSKAEGDTGWKIQGIAAEASKMASAGNGAYIYFRFHTNCDGTSAGNGQMDYLRIYGTESDLEDIKPGEGGGDDSGEGGGGTPGTVTPSGTTIESALNAFPNKTVVTGTITETASTNTWKFANSTMTSYTRSSNVGIVTPEGAKFTEDGLDLSQTNGTDVWKFSAAGGWSPMAYANDSYRALYIKMKGNVTADILMADGKSVDKLRSVPGKKLSESNEFASDGTSKSYQFRDGFIADATIDDGWVEYLIVARNTNAALVYVKSDTITEGQWIKAFGMERYYYAKDSSDPNYAAVRQTGISFSGSGVIAEWKTIDFNNSARTVVASDANAKPAGALSLLAAEEFNTEPTYTQKPAFGDAVTIENGVMHAKTRYANAAEGIRATNGTVKFTDVAIPVGGYAEFRLKSNGGKRIAFDDGVTKWFVNTNNDYSSLIGTITPHGGYVNDSDMAWRTWRIVRGENGYSFYSQAEGDTGWRIHSTDGAMETDGNGAYIQIRMDGNADGKGDGNGQLDYLRIYGPSPDAPISIVDGFGLEPATNNATLKNPGSIRLVVSDDITSGTVIVANYKGKTLKKIQTVEVSELNAENSLLNLKDGLNTNVKIFLWDSLNGNSKALSDGLTFKYLN